MSYNGMSLDIIDYCHLSFLRISTTLDEEIFSLISFTISHIADIINSASLFLDS